MTPLLTILIAILFSPHCAFVGDHVPQADNTPCAIVVRSDFDPACELPVGDSIGIVGIKGPGRACTGACTRFASAGGDTLLWRVVNVGDGDTVCRHVGPRLAVVFDRPGDYVVLAGGPGHAGEWARRAVAVSASPAAPTVEDLDPGNRHTACPGSGVLLKAAPRNPEHNIVWRTECGPEGCVYERTGLEVTVPFGDEVCDVLAYTYDRRLGCMSEEAYVHTMEERKPLPLQIASPLRVCPGAEVEWTEEEVPWQRDFLYRWEVQENRQWCASVQGSAMRGAATVLVNGLRDGDGYPASFYMTLERKFCGGQSVKDTVRFVLDVPRAGDVGIGVSADTVCAGVPVMFTPTGTTGGECLWRVDSGYAHRGDSVLQHTFMSGGDHIVELLCNNYDCCRDSRYYSRATAGVHVRPAPAAGGVALTGDGRLYVKAPPGSPYTFYWQSNAGVLADATSDTVVYEAGRSYTCTVTDTLTGCTATRRFGNDAGGAGGPDCDSMGWMVKEYDSCTATLHLKSPLAGGALGWQVGGGEYGIRYGDDRSEAWITFADAATYHVVAQHSDGDSCLYSFHDLTVPLVPRLWLEKRCTDVVVRNASPYMGGPSVVRLTVNGTDTITMSTYDDSCVYHAPAPGWYGFRLVEPFGCDIGAVEVPATYMDQLAIRVADVVADTVRVCNNTPVLLEASLMSGRPVASVRWDFGDGAVCERTGDTVYHTYLNSDDDYMLSAIVTDTNGCVCSSSVVVRSNINSLRVGKVNVTGPIVCPYHQSRTIIYGTDNIRYDPQSTIHEWAFDVSSYGRMRSVYYTDNYTVLATDSNRCWEHAQEEVLFLNRPTAVILPGTSQCCVGETVTLSGAAGADSNDYEYYWNVMDPDGQIEEYNTPTVSFPATMEGQYGAKLRVTSSEGCFADAAEAHILVHPRPVAPSIGFGNNRCLDNPPVQLVGSSPVTPELRWSNGTVGPVSHYYTHGAATAWYIDPTTGCVSDTAYIHIDAAPDFDALLTGCHRVCPSFFGLHKLPVHGLTHLQQSAEWKWYYNGNGIEGGFLDTPPSGIELPLPGYGYYSLEVMYAGHNCMVMSPALTLDWKDDCDCEGLEVECKYKYGTSNCRLLVTATVTVCNTSGRTVCLDKLEDLYDHLGTKLTSDAFLHVNLLPGGCYIFSLTYDVQQMPSSRTIPLRIYDPCNNCYQDLKIDLMPPLNHFPSVTGQTAFSYFVRTDLSNLSAAYVDFTIDLSPYGNLLALWSAPPMVMHYSYNGNQVHGLMMLDMATVTQMMQEYKKVCIGALVCKNDALIRLNYCITAAEIHNLMKQQNLVNGVGDEPMTGEQGKQSYLMHGRGEAEEASAPRLVPNPATSIVEVEDAPGEVEELTVLDMLGRQRANWQGTSRFDVSGLEQGTYIVCVVAADGDGVRRSFYLKLIVN